MRHPYFIERHSCITQSRTPSRSVSRDKEKLVEAYETGEAPMSFDFEESGDVGEGGLNLGVTDDTRIGPTRPQGAR